MQDAPGSEGPPHLCVTLKRTASLRHTGTLTGRAGGEGAGPRFSRRCLRRGPTRASQSCPVGQACPGSRSAENSTHLLPTYNFSLFWADPCRVTDNVTFVFPSLKEGLAEILFQNFL